MAYVVPPAIGDERSEELVASLAGRTIVASKVDDHSDLVLTLDDGRVIELSPWSSWGEFEYIGIKVRADALDS